MMAFSWLRPRAFYGWTPRDFNADLLAGITLAAIAIPEQMATARLGGFAPETGFIVFAAGSLAFALFGANRYLSAGADSTITPIFAGGLALLAATGSPQYLAMGAALAVMVGILVVASGFFRLGWIADLLSLPVMTGFLAGISIHIAVSQLPGLLGLPPESGHTLQRIGQIANDLHLTNPYSLALGAGVLFVMLVTERLNPRIPGALIGIAVATAAVIFLGLASRGVAVLGALPAHVPTPAWPVVSLDDIQSLLPLALLISIVVMVQTAATSRSFTGPNNFADVDRDFVGVGAGSIAAGLFGAFPVNSSPPRTAIVAETGGRSQAAGIIAAAVVLGVATWGGTLLANVPQAALAGVLLFVAQRIFHLQRFASVFRHAPVEFVLILITMAAIVALPIEIGAAIGIGLSLLHGLWSMTRTRPIELQKISGTTIWWPANSPDKVEPQPGVLVTAFQAPLSFVNANQFQYELSKMIDARRGKLKLVVLEASNIVEIDYTAGQALTETITQCRLAGATFAIARMESLRAQAALLRLGILDMIGPDKVFRSVDEAVRTLMPTSDARHQAATGAQA